jgi:hypothetical protein
MTEDEALAEMMARSDELAEYLAGAMDESPCRDKTHSVAVVTFLRLAAFAALRMGMPGGVFAKTAVEIFRGSHDAMEQEGTLPVKH